MKSFIEKVVEERNKAFEALSEDRRFDALITREQAQDVIDSNIGQLLNILSNGNYTLVELVGEDDDGEPIDVEITQNLSGEFFNAINN